MAKKALHQWVMQGTVTAIVVSFFVLLSNVIIVAMGREPGRCGMDAIEAQNLRHEHQSNSSSDVAENSR